MRISTYFPRKDLEGSIKIYPCVTAKGNVDMFHSIDIYVNYQSWGIPESGWKVEVNWSGCGSQVPLIAHQYGQGLVSAALLADQINSVGLDKALRGHTLVTQAEADAYWAEKNPPVEPQGSFK